MQLITGIYAGRYQEQTDGWRILCEQEKTPFILTNKADCTVLLCEGQTPPWIEEYLSKGGVAILTGVHPTDLPFSTAYIGAASLENVDLTELGAGVSHIQSVVHVYDGVGLGKICLHEKRKIKGDLHPDEYPAVLWQSVGAGGCWYSGIPFSQLICTLGDTLRQTPAESDYSERITSVDKHFLLRAMRSLLASAYAKQGYPYVSLHYYPETFQSVFVFRVDVDGVYGENLENISRYAKDAGVRVSFYVNQKLCQPESERLYSIDSSHYIGCHGREHNLYTSEEDNSSNIRDCREWMQKLGLPEQPGYVAPRGMWNFALNHALERNGISYTSDFGYCIYDLPFYPYEQGRRMAVKQIPVDPFSAERAYTKAEEEGTVVPDDYVFEHFKSIIQSQYAAGMPIILYSHPQYFGKLAEVVFPQLQKELQDLNVWHATMEEYSAWWDLRDSARYCAQWSEKDGLHIDWEHHPERCSVKAEGGTIA